MQHQYSEMPNVRMPRACKTTRQYTQQQRQTRKTRAAAQEEIVQQPQNVIYTTTSQVHQYSAYTISNQMNMQANQGLHPNLQHPRPTTTYTPPSMMAQRPPTGPRYHTRQAAHNMTAPNPPNMEMYWNPNLPHQAQAMPQYRAPLQTQPPITRPVERKDACTQTSFPITDKELKLLNVLRQEQIDVSKLYSIIEKSDYIVTFDETEREKQNNETKTTSNEIVSCNALQQSNDMITMAYVLELQQRLAARMSSATLPAIEFNSTQDSESSSSSEESPMQDPSLPSAYVQKEQQDVAGEKLVEEPVSQESTTHNNQPSPSSINTRPTQQQVPPENFPIPNIMNPCRYNNPMRYQSNPYDCPNFRQNPDINNINLFQAAAFFGQYYARQMQNPRGWFQNPPMFPPPHPWF